MKPTLLVVAFLLLALAGCANMNHAQQRTLSGGVIGAGTGATIGLIGGPPGFVVGALVGGVAGTVSGLYWEDVQQAAK